jgi:hypothetical protein
MSPVDTLSMSEMKSAFHESYLKIHNVTTSEASKAYDKVLFDLHEFIELFFVIRKGYSASYGRYAGLMEVLVDCPELIRTKSSVWLFYGFPIENIYDDFTTVFVKADNAKLTISDYAVLLYISYQDKETQKALEGFSLPLLHEMFNPLVDQNIDAWLLGR